MALQLVSVVERRGMFAPRLRVRCTLCGAVYAINERPSRLRLRRFGCVDCATARDPRTGRYTVKP